ncbi:alpha/beta fold hydrolase [Streptomyces pinistramenti]|uniref:alpha/beta fold hydrolase n=1 Tax=Streptomyces pinistramenti TaxID=2884812 RepID=UPI001D08B0DC|nr:alpha/beta fold hydrolase [Streptomyces pinistramenti]MCB5910173.1 alpha/beta hydrolase [Streptomyces pinistramenti]
MTEETIRNLSVDGLSYSYRVLRQPASRTEPVLVLGGALQDKYGWQHLDAPVLTVTSLISIDLPGSGDADPLRSDQGWDVMHDAIEQVIDDLGISRVNIFGYSFGSVLAFTFAQRRPGRVARLLLGGVPASTTDEKMELWHKAAGHMAAGELDAFVDLVLELTLCQDESRTVRHRKLVHRYVKRLLAHAVTRTAHGFDVLERSSAETVNPSGVLRGVPTLVFCGEHDNVSTPDRQRAFADTIEGSRFVSFAEADHWVALERAEEVIDLLLRFFTDRPLETAGFAPAAASRAPHPEPASA